jgi:hypothetical protein
MKGVLSWLVCWAHCADIKDFCPVLAALIGSVQNIFFHSVHYITSFVPLSLRGYVSLFLLIIISIIANLLIQEIDETGGLLRELASSRYVISGSI